jgi:hypothetical protein
MPHSRLAIARTRTTVRLAAVLTAPALAALLVAACGGGGGATTPPVTTLSTTWADGPIRGFGSVIVNGVRFDDSGASVTDDEDRHMSSTELELGMEVEIEAGDDQGGRAAAHGFHVHSAAVGPVEAVNAAAGTLTVIGQSVVVDATTVIDDSLPGGLGGLAGGEVLRVYGSADGSGTIHATRLEAAGAVGAYRVVGAVAAYDATGRTLQVGGASIDVSGVASLPAGLAAGLRVRVVLATTPAAGLWRATSVKADDHHFQGDHDEAQLHGTITDVTSAASFSVDGTPVDASHATFPDGQAGVVLGAVVEVEGALVNGTLVATKVGLESEHENEGTGVELHGAISNLDTTAKTFTLRGSVVSYAADGVVFRDGTSANLANDVHVEVKGDLDADGHTVDAATIDFTND